MSLQWLFSRGFGQAEAQAAEIKSFRSRSGEKQLAVQLREVVSMAHLGFSFRSLDRR